MFPELTVDVFGVVGVLFGGIITTGSSYLLTKDGTTAAK
jgi:hypothetical protein